MNNKLFWEEQAKKYNSDVKAVNFDPLSEILENLFFEKYLDENKDTISIKNICDLGCGNGRTILYLANKYENIHFIGIDFIEDMIKTANLEKNLQKIKNVDFFVFDASDTNLPNKLNMKFDLIYTKRLLINLKDNLKFKALKNIKNMLYQNGKYIMIECFEEPLMRINEVRNSLNLKKIEVKFFNEYLKDNILNKVSENFKLEKEYDIGSLYYFISRVFNAKLSNGNPDYFSEINKLAIEISKYIDFEIIKGYSPQRYLVYIKK